jgi:ferredoxin
MISKIKKEIIEKKDEKSVREATDSCPANAIEIIND